MQWATPIQWGKHTLVLAQAADHLTEDPLIDQGAENAVYIGILLLGIVLTVAVGIFSNRAKVAILLALFLSAMLIAIIIAT